MKYRNVKTGLIVDSPCTINGNDWEQVSKPASDVSVEKSEKKPVKISKK